ncbi:MAG: hypothetical protein LC660_01325 [Desulfobacteraceae bacterium]|nr:hypothetical protein [Desulfobacteraceae bacterium]
MNCAGPYAKIIGNLAGLGMPLRTVRRQKAYIRTSYPDLPAHAVHCGSGEPRLLAPGSQRTVVRLGGPG